METVVKKWFRDKDTGFLDNGNGPDIMVCKADLVNCQFLKVGAVVEFECHQAEHGLIAKKVQLSNQKKKYDQNTGKKSPKAFHFGVMT